MLTKAAPPSLLEYFADLPDPRIDRCKEHELIDIRTIAILATICGAEHFTEMETFGEAKHDWLKTFLTLKNGIPSHDTFARVFARLQPAASNSRPRSMRPYWRTDVTLISLGCGQHSRLLPSGNERHYHGCLICAMADPRLFVTFSC